MYEVIRGNNANEMGMRLNEKKTVLLCISAATSFVPNTYINTGDGPILSGKSLKLLVFTFTQWPNCNEQIHLLRKKVRGRAWLIRRLKRAKMSQPDLNKMYVSLVRPFFLII